MTLAIEVRRDGKPPVRVDVRLLEAPGPFESLKVIQDAPEVDSTALSDAAALRGFLTRLVSDGSAEAAAVCYRPREARLRALLAELGGTGDPIVVTFDG